jgi:hypothetical protein
LGEHKWPIIPYVETFEFDVVEDRTRVVADTMNAYGVGVPAQTSSFVTYGYIYPAGTLRSDNRILSNGELEFPELVIGRWTRRAYTVGDVLSRQTYDLGGEFGNVTLVSEGYDIADEHGVIRQAITGGEGEYRNAHGGSRQELVGFNSTGGVNLRLMLSVNVQ